MHARGLQGVSRGPKRIAQNTPNTDGGYKMRTHFMGLEAKFIDESNSDGVVIEITATLMEFVF